MPRYILALDQGTTSSRAILFDEHGAQVGISQQEYPQIYPQPGWVEHAPESIWASQLSVIRAVLRDHAVAAADIAAIGITNQRETTLIWDRATGEPIHNAIVWQCRRTAPMCEQLKAEGFDRVIAAKTGLVTDAYFSGTKIAWLLEHVEGARERAERGELAFGTVDTWLMWQLSGGALHVTDVSNASRTLVYNIHTGDWDSEILARLRIPRALLPTVQASSGHFGETAPALFGAPIPICGVAGDQQAATFGQLCLRPGMVKNTYGTGCFMLMNTGDQAVASAHNLLTTVAWRVADAPVQYALEGGVFIAGAVVQWLRDELGMVRNSAEASALATTVSDTGRVFFVPAFVGLGAPYWDAYARGTIVGLTRGSGRAHIVRAALESVAYSVADVLTAMQKDSGIGVSALRVDGGMAKSDFVLQFQADLLDVPVQRPRITETSALGVAYLAGMATGIYQNPETLSAAWQMEREFTPNMPSSARAALLEGWHAAIDRARAWAE
jgi:glycerol kinase